MKYYVYILKSIKSGRYYIGHTSRLKSRMKEHNAGLNKSTRSGKPYKIIYWETFDSKSLAYKRELKIKSYKGGNAFKRLIAQW